KDEENRHGPSMEDERFKAGVDDSSTAVPPHERVRGTGRQSQRESDEVPDNCAEEAGEKHLLIHHFDVHHPFADGAGDGGAEDERGDEIPEGGPEDGAKRGQDARGDDGGDGIGGVVPAVRELEGEGDADGKGNESEAVHGDQLFFKMTLSMTLETSSHLSTAVSMTSKISFHLMICTESFSSSKSWAISVRQMRSLSFSRRLISMTRWSALSGISMAWMAAESSAQAAARTLVSSMVPGRTVSTR